MLIDVLALIEDFLTRTTSLYSQLSQLNKKLKNVGSILHDIQPSDLNDISHCLAIYGRSVIHSPSRSTREGLDCIIIYFHSSHHATPTHARHGIRLRNSHDMVSTITRDTSITTDICT